MATNDEIMSDLASLKREVSEMRTEMVALRRALIGSYDTPGGLAVIIEKNRGDIAELRSDFFQYRAERERLIKEYDVRVSEVEQWIEAMKNRAIGIAIGISLGSASIGALVAQLFGG